MIELWPLEWLYRALCGCCPVTNIYPPCCPGESLCLYIICSLAPSAPALPCHLGSQRKNEERDKRKENKHWSRGSFFACNIYVFVCVCVHIYEMLQESRGVLLVVIRVGAFTPFLKSDFSLPLCRTFFLCLSSFFLVLNLGLDFGWDLMTHHATAATTSQNHNHTNKILLILLS